MYRAWERQDRDNSSGVSRQDLTFARLMCPRHPTMIRPQRDEPSPRTSENVQTRLCHQGVKRDDPRTNQAARAPSEMSAATSRRAPVNPALSAIADAKPFPFWLDGPDAPSVHSALVVDETADLTVVGGGFTGLWTALLAKERDPGRDVVLLERESCPSGASGRNGGFLMGTLTDYWQLPRYEGQTQAMADLGDDNRAQLEAALERHAIDCDLEATGWVLAATRDWHLEPLKQAKSAGAEVGLRSIAWTREEIQSALRSPQFLAGVYQPDAIAIVHPGKLAWGLKRACERAGVRFFERTPATSLERAHGGIRVATPLGSVTSPNVALGTYAHRSPIRSMRWWRIPLYSHVLATEPLTSEQLGSIGWSGRQGFTELDPFLYYYRLTKDNRIIWGYVDGTLHWNRAVRPEFEQDLPVFANMARAFLQRFPQLEGMNFTHRWGGALDNTSRGAPFFGTTMEGRVAYAHGYMSGVGGSRAGATIMLDLLAGEQTMYTQLPLVSGPGLHGQPSLRPFPPEPFLTLGTKLVTAAVRKEQETGQPTVLTRALSRLGYVISEADA